jgi:hypothetical protein
MISGTFDFAMVGAVILLTIVISGMILAWSMAALCALRRHRLYDSTDRLEQFVAVGMLASGDPNFGTKLALAMLTPMTAPRLTLLIHSLSKPRDRNLIEGTIFHQMHPEITAGEVLSAILSEIEEHGSRRRWFALL